MDTVTFAAEHRQRLLERFLAGVEQMGDEGVLEILLSFGAPQKDPRPLARQLLAMFGSLPAVLSADVKELGRFKGLNAQTAALLKVADWLRLNLKEADVKSEPVPEAVQMGLFNGDPLFDELIPACGEPQGARKPALRRGTGMFAKALLREAIELLPAFPDTASLRTLRGYLAENLPFEAEESRKRYGDYIIHHLFPDGYADGALRRFARLFEGTQELRDVCFYRFCRAEPLMLKVTEDLLVPSVEEGALKRSSVFDYLAQRFPGASLQTVGSCASSIIEALTAGGIVGGGKARHTVAHRDISPLSFAFVLHSEFPVPGMHEMGKLERNPLLRAMLWRPDDFVAALHRLREQGVLSEVTELFNIRRFGTQWSLDQLVTELVTGRRIQ